MSYLIIIMLGGALGALSRYLFSAIVHDFAGRAFPYATLMVNVLGSFLAGIVSIVFIVKMGSAFSQLRAFLLIGFLGSFTTFSTFSLETLCLFEQGDIFKGTINVILNLLLSLLLMWFGLFLGRQLIS